MRILEGRGVTKYFGGLAAVSNVDFHIDQGEILGLIGPNGAGKTTLFNLISAAIPFKSGEIRFKGQTLSGFNSDKERTWKPKAAGILSIIGGVGQVIMAILSFTGAAFIGSFIGWGWFGVTGDLQIFIGILHIVLGGIAIAGGICALRRNKWGLALAGAICALLGPGLILGILAIIFVILGKGEFWYSMGPHQICKMGIARTFQETKVFANMPVLQNVLVGAFFGSPNLASGTDAAREASQALEFVGLSALSATPVKDLTLVNQKRTEVARALATKPEVLLLDELMAGLNPTEISEAMELVTKIRDRGITIFMVEHVMKAIMGICERIMVLHHGEKIAEGTPQEITANKKVIEIYLGEETHAGS